MSVTGVATSTFCTTALDYGERSSALQRCIEALANFASVPVSVLRDQSALTALEDDSRCPAEQGAAAGELSTSARGSLL